jgi:enoyl-CoA hydratase
MSLLSIRRAGAVTILTLDDPKRRNILSLELCGALSAAVRAAEADEGVKALVFTGAAPAFCAGADLDDLKAAANGNTANVEAVYQSFIDVANCSLPTIAAVNGAAIGAGFNLALACDLRIASDEAMFDTRFLKIGLHPGGGHSWMLLRAVGWAEASRMLLLGKQIYAVEAARIGLVQSVATPARLLEAALELAGSADAAPRDLVLAAKATMRMAAHSSHRQTFEHETHEQLLSLGQPAFQELVSRLQANIGSR